MPAADICRPFFAPTDLDSLDTPFRINSFLRPELSTFAIEPEACRLDHRDFQCEACEHAPTEFCSMSISVW